MSISKDDVINPTLHNMRFHILCEIYICIENPNDQLFGRKPARRDHLFWSEDPLFPILGDFTLCSLETYLLTNERYSHLQIIHLILFMQHFYTRGIHGLVSR